MRTLPCMHVEQHLVGGVSKCHSIVRSVHNHVHFVNMLRGVISITTEESLHPSIQGVTGTQTGVILCLLLNMERMLYCIQF